MNSSMGLPAISLKGNYTGKWQNIGDALVNGVIDVDNPNGNNVWSSLELMEEFDPKNDADNYVWQPKIESTTEAKVVKRDIHYTYEDGEKAADDVVDTVTFERTKSENLVTGVATYSDWQAQDGDTTFEAVTSPSIDNYTANKIIVDEVTGLTAAHQDSEVTVTYSPQLETTTENKKVNQTIHYVYEDGTKAVDDATDTVSFTREATKNLATGEVTYSDWNTTFDAVTSLELKNYAADKKVVEEVTGVTASSKDSEVTVTYVKEKAATPPTTPSSTPAIPSSSTPTEKGKAVTTDTTKQTVKVAASPVEKVTKHFMNLPTTGDKVGVAATIFGVAIIAGVAILGAVRLKRESK